MKKLKDSKNIVNDLPIRKDAKIIEYKKHVTFISIFQAHYSGFNHLSIKLEDELHFYLVRQT